ncbi:MAG: DUF3231 family protein [Tumebacillaceae bacterium]
MNPFELIKDAFAPFLDGEKKPLHTGEVFNLWTYLTGAECMLHQETIYYNVAENEDLKAKLRDLAENIHKPIILELREFLKKEGVPLPEPPAEKVRAPLDIYALPDHARPNDKEIANTMVFGLIEAIQFAGRAITESVRADVGYLFAKYLMMKTTFSMTVKPMMEEHGWLKVPPYYKG